MTDASGIATVGSWTLGAAAGANTLTATSAGLTGSPVTFTATGDAGVLLVQHNGTPVRAYSLDRAQGAARRSSATPASSRPRHSAPTPSPA